MFFSWGGGGNREFGTKQSQCLGSFLPMSGGGRGMAHEVCMSHDGSAALAVLSFSKNNLNLLSFQSYFVGQSTPELDGFDRV